MRPPDAVSLAALFYFVVMGYFRSFGAACDFDLSEPEWVSIQYSE
jgi:hypothetical protein